MSVCEQAAEILSNGRRGLTDYSAPTHTRSSLPAESALGASVSQDDLHLSGPGSRPTVQKEKNSAGGVIQRPSSGKLVVNGSSGSGSGSSSRSSLRPQIDVANSSARVESRAEPAVRGIEKKHDTADRKFRLAVPAVPRPLITDPNVNSDFLRVGAAPFGGRAPSSKIGVGAPDNRRQGLGAEKGRTDGKVAGVAESATHDWLRSEARMAGDRAPAAMPRPIPARDPAPVPDSLPQGIFIAPTTTSASTSDSRRAMRGPRRNSGGTGNNEKNGDTR